MARLATLSNDLNLSLIFESYEERYEGAYPNLKFMFKVRAKFVGQFSIDATNTLKFGPLSTTKYMYYGKWTSDSGWFNLGEISTNVGCARSVKRNYSCSCSGWPNLSGNGSITSFQVGLPNFTHGISDVTQTQMKVSYNLSTNPHNLYALWINNKTKSKTILSGATGSGHIVDTGLSNNTTYEYEFYSKLADNSGNSLVTKTQSQRTLENYPAIRVSDCNIAVSEVNELTKAEFRMVASDTAHISQYHFQLNSGSVHSSSSNYYSVSNLENNTEMTITCWTTDTLGRTSAKYSKKFSTIYTFMEVYVLVNGVWKIGYPMVLSNGKWELAMIHPFNGRSWGNPKPLDKANIPR